METELKTGDWIKTPCSLCEGPGKPIIQDYNYGRVDEINHYQALCNMIDPFGKDFDKIYPIDGIWRVHDTDMLRQSTLKEGVLYLRMRAKYLTGKIINHEQ